MARLLKNILSFALFFGGFYIGINLIIAVSTAFTPKVEKLLLRHTAVSKYEYQRIKDLEIWLQQSDTKKTALILGSSTAYMNINPQILSASTGIDFFNCGTSSQTIAHSAAILKHILPEHRPDYLLLDVYPGMWNTTTTEASTDWVINYPLPHQTFILRMVASESSLTLWNLYFYTLIKRCLPFAEYTQTDTIEHSKYVGKGHVCISETLAGYKAIHKEYTSIKKANAEALNEIENVCRVNNITLIVLLPKAINAHVNKKAIKTTTAYVIDVENVTDEKYYRDSYHMHCEGAERFSYWLAGKLNEYQPHARSNISQ